MCERGFACRNRRLMCGIYCNRRASETTSELNSALSVNSMKLSEIQNHAAACVNCLELDGAMRRRLQDIGFVPGARICFAYRSPFGDPNAYFIGGALVALRRSEAEKIDVTQTR